MQWRNWGIDVMTAWAEECWGGGGGGYRRWRRVFWEKRLDERIPFATIMHLISLAWWSQQPQCAEVPPAKVGGRRKEAVYGLDGS